jgi:predicted AlkP superfamily phosphohydrolase/phosphomutase
MTRVAVIGLDCLVPELVFDQWRDGLPNLKALRERSAWGRLESCIPPITVPAWSCMLTGRDPGELGFYGFRNRGDFNYEELQFATSALVREKRVWDILSERGKNVILLGVPQSYPPTPVRGSMVGCFLTPSIESEYTYPPQLKHEIADVVGEYLLDVMDFRTDDKQRIVDQIYEMTNKRFKLAHHLLRTKPWDFFMMVEMGTDRMHHGFWGQHAPEHPKFEKGGPFEFTIRDYYRHVDRLVGELLEALPPDTHVLLVSDHGAKTMYGGLCINDWLIQEGYLVLKEKPREVTQFKVDMVDWSRTRVWGAGGYYGRVFFNVQGREPAGIVPRAQYESLRNEIKEKVERLTNDKGKPMANKVFRPEDIYREVRNIPPDLIVYFDDLNWRSVGSVGFPEIYTFENDTGPDEANHAQHGVFMLRKADGALTPGERTGLHLEDVAPTILSLFDVERPESMHGRVVS